MQSKIKLRPSYVMLRPTKPFQIFQKERADLKFSESDERLGMRTFDSQRKLAMYEIHAHWARTWLCRTNLPSPTFAAITN